VPTLEDIAGSQTTLGPEDIDRLQALIGSWQILADLAFSDLLLWVPDSEGDGVWVAAQIRPTTGPTTLVEDVVGMFVPRQELPAHENLPNGAQVRVDTIEVRRGERPIAWLSRRRYRRAQRSPSALERAYLETSDMLMEMVRGGRFPVTPSRIELADSLRVGDGLVRTDAAGRVIYASPNALSAYRRLGLIGDLVDADFISLNTDLMRRRPGELGFASMFGSAETHAELEGQGTSLHMRIIPLTTERTREGYLVLMRDVTELRSRERELVSKEATIREIHHRVKNNLQTVAALLRLQSRRVAADEAKDALREAERRVGSIALVHETLSRSLDELVEFDQVADTLLRTISEFADDTEVTPERIGSFGVLPSEVATSLAMVLSELLQNAIEHAFTEGEGRLTVAVNRIRGRLRIRVADDGRGFSQEVDTTRSLGLSIVRALVEGELGGELVFASSPSGGASVSIAFDVR